MVQQSKKAKHQHPTSNRHLRKRPNAPVASCLSYLPGEILYLILDLIDYRTYTKLQSTVQVPIGDDYWRQRAVRLLSGVDTIKEDKNQLDWRHLCLELERLHESSIKFRIRRRVLAALEEIKAAFFRQLKKDEPLRMKDVVIKIQNSWPYDDVEGNYIEPRKYIVWDC